MSEYAVDFYGGDLIALGKLYSIHTVCGFSAIQSERGHWIDTGAVDLIVEIDE